ncbi:MAG: S46 family peptidase [Gemmatimonadota bacterium]|nr:MAG: S46 family peptidase [Gemmatimonadota bacterium]
MNTKRPGAVWARMAPVAALALAVGCGARATAVTEPTPAPEPEPAPAVSIAAGIDLDTIRAGEFDNGKMWTFEYPPLEYFRETYHFEPDQSWFERVRLGALRIQGCSASFVSPNGLVLTNHHCARENVSEVSQPGENLLDNGFYARSLDEERESSQTADQLIAIKDVTEEVYAALEGTAEAERGAALDEIREELSERIAEEHGGDEAGILVQVIELWDGAKYSAYVFRRYTNLRLVASPELQLGHFGGDPDNFTYPRYDLDFSFYRIYDTDGNPLKPEHWFNWSDKGVEEGDAVFVIGNPGGSSRLQTVAQLEWRGAVRDKVIYELLGSRADALQAFYDEDPERGEEMDLRNEIFGLLNSEKAFRGMWSGLQNPIYMARRRDSERQFRDAIENDPALSAKYGGLLERMAEIQKQRTPYAADFGAFAALGNPDFDAAALLRAFLAYRYVTASVSGAPQEVLDNLKGRVLAISDQPPSLQRRLLIARLTDFERHLGADSEIGRMILQGRTPEVTADAILASSALADSAQTASVLETGVLTADDPAIQMVATIIERLGAYQTAFQQLGQQEGAIANALGRARFDVYGTSIPPDATFSLRVADGVVKGYEYNGTYAPIYTTFYGLYDHYYSYGPGTDWDLPARWLSPPETLDLATPLNFVLTADVIGGNSGSPVINTDLEVVGLIFDGNIESLPGDYIYDPEVNRAVAVDVRGILEALDDMYDADRLVLELTTGQLVPTEAEADAVLAGK